MGSHTHGQHVDAPPAAVFDLYIDLERMSEWVGGVTGVVDLSGPVDVVGTTYTVMFGKVKSPTRVVEVERPRRFVTHFGNAILKGTNHATFEPEDGGTRVTVRLDTEGFVSRVMAWVFSLGSGKGTFKGELAHFARLAEAGARKAPEGA